MTQQDWYRPGPGERVGRPRGRAAAELALLAAAALTLAATGPTGCSDGTPTASNATATPTSGTAPTAPPAANDAPKTPTNPPPPPGATPLTPAAAKADLHDRANALWTAKRDEDWAAVFPFRDPSEQTQATVEQFTQWSRENEPFQTHSFEISDAIVDGSVGWIRLQSKVSMRKFPDLPARDVDRWDTWRLLDGVWYPITSEQADAFPVSPAGRNLADEPALRARWIEQWTARETENWAKLHQMFDPRNRPEVGDVETAETESPYDFVDYDILWVEAVGDNGRVRVVLSYKAKDLEKWPVQNVAVNNRWVKVDGEWYMYVGTQRAAQGSGN